MYTLNDVIFPVQCDLITWMWPNPPFRRQNAYNYGVRLILTCIFLSFACFGHKKLYPFIYFTSPSFFTCVSLLLACISPPIKTKKKNYVCLSSLPFPSPIRHVFPSILCIWDPHSSFLFKLKQFPKLPSSHVFNYPFDIPSSIGHLPSNLIESVILSFQTIFPMLPY